jgi:hypothetical protein
MVGMDKTGKTNFVEYIGSSISEGPGDIVWNSATKQVNVFGSTNSVSYQNQGGTDWLVFLLDYKGRNQCSAL